MTKLRLRFIINKAKHTRVTDGTSFPFVMFYVLQCARKALVYPTRKKQTLLSFRVSRFPTLAKTPKSSACAQSEKKGNQLLNDANSKMRQPFNYVIVGQNKPKTTSRAASAAAGTSGSRKM